MMNIFVHNRGLLHKIRIGILLFTFCMLSMQVMSQTSKSKIARLLQRNKIERLLRYSDSQISELTSVGDLRILGEVFLNNHYYEQSDLCYKKILTDFDDLSLPKDYMNHYFILLNQKKHELVRESDLHKFDSDRWVRLLKSAARVPDYSPNKEMIKSSDLSSHISSFNGFSVTNDTIYYFPHHDIKEVDLFETDVILSHRSSREELRMALLSNDSIVDVSVLDKTFKSQSLKYNGRQVFVLQNSKHVFYSVESLKSGRQSIIIRSDSISPFPFNSDDYDCAMPSYDEKSHILYFCSNKSGGYGNLDIYSSEYKDGKWGLPINMGDKINTPFTEVFPVMTCCGLLFSCDGRAGMGGFDNYLYSSKDDTSYNLFPYNSVGNDYGLREIQKTSIGFENDNLVNYSSLLCDVFAQVRNEEDGLFAFLYPDQFGELNSPLLAKKDSLKKEQNEQDDEAKRDKLSEREDFINSGKIYFDVSQWTINDSQFSLLDSIYESIVYLNIKQIYVSGYTDVSGSVLSNNILAYNRALAVINYFKAKGVEGENPNFTPVAIGENLSSSELVKPEERKVHFLIADKKAKGSGAVAINQPNCEKLTYLSFSKLHLVASGETVFQLCKMYDCRIELMKQINSRENDIIFKGEYLFIPDNTELNRK